MSHFDKAVEDGAKSELFEFTLCHGFLGSSNHRVLHDSQVLQNRKDKLSERRERFRAINEALWSMV